MGYFQQHWDKVREKRTKILDSGHAVVRIYRTRVQVICPYSEVFNARARSLSGRWRPRTGMWTFRLEARHLVVAAANEAFGSKRVRDLTEES